jgi:hypothetical protein
MKACLPVFATALLLASQPLGARQVEEVQSTEPDTPALPEDLFRLPPGQWVFARQLWKGDEPCTAEECEAGYTSADLVVSVERSKTYLRIIAGFRDCGSVAWNQYKIGKKASSRDTKTIGKRIKRTIETSAKYCKLPAPPVDAFDARQLYPIEPQPAQ